MTLARKGVNENKGETPYLERCHVALRLHLAWSKAHSMLNTIFKEVVSVEITKEREGSNGTTNKP
jgi:hypothetical protein